ncbi:hypothetical protein NDA07_14300 [Microcoleus vaginatus DQ-U2]|uniref:hypothetical protein n=1 Tax=Microcoleus vaginatus TaxID=119532 RepID=UPI0016856172|nr:hypothetical protein [Microcoleus sp. FACHB-DQ6]
MPLRRQVSIAYVGFLTIHNAQLATRLRGTSLWEAEHRYRYRYIDEESFFATAAGQTVNACSGVKSNDSPKPASPRYERPGPVFQLSTAEFCH